MMTEERYKEIESILCNIKYIEKSPPKCPYFENSAHLYSKTVEFIDWKELDTYFKKKYKDALKNAIGYADDMDRIFLYDKDMKETEILPQFISYHYNARNYDGHYWSHFFRKYHERYTVLHTKGAGIFEKCGDAFKSSIENINYKISKRLGTAHILVNFSLSFLKQYTIEEDLTENSDEIKDYFDYKKFLSDKEIDILEGKRKKFLEELEYMQLKELYQGYTNIFNLYDNLSDEEKLKLKLTGKI